MNKPNVITLSAGELKSFRRVARKLGLILTDRKPPPTGRNQTRAQNNAHLNRHNVGVCLVPERFQQLNEFAKGRGWSLSKAASVILAQYLDGDETT